MTTVKKTVSQWDGKFKKRQKATESTLSSEAVRKNILTEVKQAVKQAEAIRMGSENKAPIDISFGAFVQEKYGFSSLGSFYESLGISSSTKSIGSLAAMPDFNEEYRWLIPEVIREAVRLGIRRNPTYPNLIAEETNVSQRQVVMPSVNMSAATPSVIGEGDTIPVGTVSFNERSVKLRKYGVGLHITDEVQRYVSLNVLSLFLQDAGVRMAAGMDTLAVSTLLNGDISEGAYSAPVIGVQNTTNGISYIDILRAWIRMGRLGRTPNAMISNEETGITILQLPEFKGSDYMRTKADINVQTPIPANQSYYIHGAMSAGNTLALIDPTSALVKLNATGLLVDSERIAANQINGTYVTQTTGFAKLFRDSFLVLDGSLDFATNGFPTFMNVDAEENVSFRTM